MFFRFHVELVLTNSSTLDNLERQRNPNAGPNVFDVGAYENFTQVFGTNTCMWFLPTTPTNSNRANGVVWPKNQWYDTFYCPFSPTVFMSFPQHNSFINTIFMPNNSLYHGFVLQAADLQFWGFMTKRSPSSGPPVDLIVIICNNEQCPERAKYQADPFRSHDQHHPHHILRLFHGSLPSVQSHLEKSTLQEPSNIRHQAALRKLLPLFSSRPRSLHRSHHLLHPSWCSNGKNSSIQCSSSISIAEGEANAP